VLAALPEAALADDQSLAVGEIRFRQLSPGSNKFEFNAETLGEIAFFEDVTAFSVEVDMAGMAAVRLNLPGSAVALSPPPETLVANLRDIAGVTVVGPEEAVRALTSDNLSGIAELPEDAAAGNIRLPVMVSVDSDDCWVFGEYEVRGVLARR